MKEALDEVRRILTGIDIDEYDSDVGWWETSDGAHFGAEKLAEVEALVRSLVPA
ncbi:MAG: hypothetical protein LBE05_04285 [Microbacterium sp.]|nr:hypothetical protein [Microbacterium sp.]